MEEGKFDNNMNDKMTDFISSAKVSIQFTPSGICYPIVYFKS